MASETDFVPDQRLHPLSWLFVLLTFVRQFIIPLIAVIVFGARDDGTAWGALFVIPLLIGAVWRQTLYRYGFGPRGLVIREGLFFRNVRQIEYERIENIDTQRGVLHRFFNVAEVRLESSTGGKPEALIRVLSLDAVQALRERVFGTAHSARPTHEAAKPREDILLRLSPAELMRYGFVDNRGMLVVAAAFGVVSQTGAMGAAGRFLRDQFFADGATTLGLSLVLVAVGVLMSLFFLVRLLSLLWALVSLHDFTLSRVGADLRIRYGLLTSVALTLRLPRIQAAHQTESFLHRFFGRVSVAVDLAGDGGGQVDANGSPTSRMRWLAPICSPRRATDLIRTALPILANDTPPEWQTLAPGTQMRIFRRVVLVTTLVFAAPAIFWLRYEAPLVWLVTVPLAWVHAKQYVRYTRWALTREAVLFRRGWLTRRLSIIPRNRVQVVHEVVSPFDRRKRTATLSVDTAGVSVLAGVVRIRYLTQEAARMLADALYVSVLESRNDRSSPPRPA